VAVTDLHWYGPTATDSRDTLLVGTAGRGAFTIRNHAADLETTPILTINGTSNNDVIELERDGNTPDVLNLFEYDRGSARPSLATRKFDRPNSS
jgi:hypothetical protein